MIKENGFKSDIIRRITIEMGLYDPSKHDQKVYQRTYMFIKRVIYRIWGTNDISKIYEILHTNKI